MGEAERGLERGVVRVLMMCVDQIWLMALKRRSISDLVLCDWMLI